MCETQCLNQKCQIISENQLNKRKDHRAAIFIITNMVTSQSAKSYFILKKKKKRKKKRRGDIGEEKGDKRFRGRGRRESFKNKK